MKTGIIMNYWYMHRIRGSGFGAELFSIKALSLLNPESWNPVNLSSDDYYSKTEHIFYC